MFTGGMYKSSQLVTVISNISPRHAMVGLLTVYNWFQECTPDVVFEKTCVHQGRKGF